MGAWDGYTRDAEIGSGGDFPVVEDGLFEAQIQDITEPRDGTDFNGQPCKKFVIKWEIVSEDVAPDTVLWQYVTLPPKYLEEGVLSEKSNLHKVMTALGFDLSGRFRVNPPSWQGMEARVLVENFPVTDEAGVVKMRPKLDEDGNAVVDKNGNAVLVPVTKPRITKVSAKRQKGNSARNNGNGGGQPPKREPVAASNSRRGGAPFGQDDEEE